MWEHAQTQGSVTDQDKFQMSYACMVKKALCFQDRNALTASQLAQVIEAERLACEVILNSITDNIHYKQIYKLVKAKVQAYADVARL